MELKTGEVYRGMLLEAEDNWNSQMKDITVTGRVRLGRVDWELVAAEPGPPSHCCLPCRMAVCISWRTFSLGEARSGAFISQLSPFPLAKEARSTRVRLSACPLIPHNRYMILPDMLKNAPMFKKASSAVRVRTT